MLPRPDLIRDTIFSWINRSKRADIQVAFYGGSFTLLPKRVQQQLLEAVQPFINDRLVSSIRISTRPDALSDETLDFIAAYNVRTVEIGVQSLDDRVLEKSLRGHTAADSLDAIRRTKNAGFHTGVQLLPGLPGDTAEIALNSMKQIIMIRPSFVRIYPAVVLAGTELATLYNSGLYHPPDLEEGVKSAARMLHHCLQGGIPVIRVGLQSEPALTAAGGILAGCWHPALGQLVRGELYHQLFLYLAKRLNNRGNTGGLQLFCNPRSLSDLKGHGNKNLSRWRKMELAVQNISFDEQLSTDQLAVSDLNQNIKGSIITTSIYEEF